MKSGPRVLVTDAEHRSVLAACRGLAAAGYRVSTVAEERFALAHWSRFPEKKITLAGPRNDPEGYVDRLSRVLRGGDYDLLMPGTELSLLPISERRDLIEPYARLGLPSHEDVVRALDKPLFQSKAKSVGLASPRSIFCSNAEEALAAAVELTFPLLVKPVRSVAWTHGRIRQHGAQIVSGATELEAAVVAMGMPLNLQEYVPNATMVSCAAVRVGDGRMLGLTFAHYARTYPSQVGMAAMATTISPPKRLSQQVDELLESIGWRGIFELELLKVDENRFSAIDLNPRPFGWMALAIGAGANLPALWCDHVLGFHKVSTGEACVGVHYRWEDGDMRNALALLRSGRPRYAAAVLRPRRHVVHAHFRIDDPGPMVARIFVIARKVGLRSMRDHARPRAAGSTNGQDSTPSRSAG